MVFKFFPNIKNSDKGVTLVEIAVVIFIIVLFSLIVISDFPKIKRQFALSRATYKLAQDLRRVEDLGLSGVQINDASKTLIKAKGYGIYINLTLSPTQYVIYADVDNNQKYNDGQFCDSADRDPARDCAVEIIDVSDKDPGLSLQSMDSVVGGVTSINFSPPNPTVRIDNIISDGTQIVINLSNGLSTRSVLVNISGLINVQ